MVPIELEESAGPDPSEAVSADPLRRIVQVALAIYLMPVILIVCAIGGTSIAFDRTAKLAARFTRGGRRAERPGHLPSPRARSKATVPVDRRRVRAGH